MRTDPRTRHYVSPSTLALSRPVLRYSEARDAFVLRVIGNRGGPVLRPDRRLTHHAYRGHDRRDLTPQPRVKEALPVTLLEHALISTGELKRVEVHDRAQLLEYVAPDANTDFASRFEILSVHLSDEDYWRMLAALWVATDRPGLQIRVWRRLFSATRPHRHLLMNETEREILAGLAARVEIFRGFCEHEGGDWHGMSWTLDRACAETCARRWGAMRRNEPPLFVASVTVPRDLIVAAFDRESLGGVEVVVPSMRGRKPSVTALGSE